MQRMLCSKAKKLRLSEKLTSRRYAGLFLENHSLEFHEIWHENTVSNLRIEKNWTLTKEIQDMPANLQQGIIKDLFVKLLLK